MILPPGKPHASAAWLDLLRFTLTAGDRVHIDRLGMDTLELQGASLNIPLRRCVVAVPRRGLNYRFAAAETLWILAGRDDLAALAGIVARYREFSDDGERLAGAYGPRFVQQLPYIVDTLARDATSRQAVTSLWAESPAPSRDIPCTLTLQWLARRGQLHCHVHMRSSDLWLGLPYDLLAFACMTYRVLQELAGRHLVLAPGRLVWSAGSAHLYAGDQERARQLSVETDAGELTIPELPAAWETAAAPMLADLTAARDLTHTPGQWRLKPW